MNDRWCGAQAIASDIVIGTVDLRPQKHRHECNWSGWRTESNFSTTTTTKICCPKFPILKILEKEKKINISLKTDSLYLPTALKVPNKKGKKKKSLSFLL